jgi:hypothetical protein
MENWASVDRFRAATIASAAPIQSACPADHGRDPKDPGTAPLASLQKEITLLQQTTQTLRELAHTHKAPAHRVSNATNLVQRLAPGYNGPPAQLDLAGSQPGGQRTGSGR